MNKQYTEIEIDEMRQWLCELTWSNITANDIMKMSDVTIIRAIEQYYDGGLKQFAIDGMWND